MDASLLQNRDYTVILAKPAADMVSPPPGFAERWTAAESAVLALVQKCEEFDPDGITVFLPCYASEACEFNQYDRITSPKFTQVLREHLPPEQINLKPVLETALDNYFNRRAAGKTKANGEMILVLIDGEPSDRMAIAKLIREATHKLESNKELGIGFVQIGEDLLAKGFLTALDDNLKAAGAKFDIVKTTMLDEIQPASLTQFLLSTLQN